MTKENCIKYLEEAKDEETKKFWSDRIARKYPIIMTEEENKPEEEEKTE